MSLLHGGFEQYQALFGMLFINTRPVFRVVGDLLMVMIKVIAEKRQLEPALAGK
jgi:hypothetical protein